MGLFGFGDPPKAPKLADRNPAGQDASVYTQNPYRAYQQFGHDQSNIYWGATPLLAFQYYVRFYFDEDVLDEMFSNDIKANTLFASLDATDVPHLGPMLKNFTMPSMSIDTDVYNEYNRKRISQSKINFEPVTLTFHDVVNGVTSGIWQAYYMHYFNDGSPIDKTGAVKGDVVKTQEINPSGESVSEKSFGYNLPNLKNKRNLISRIEIFQIHAAKAQKTTLYNPRISKFDADTMTYEESRPVEVSYTMEYEYATFEFTLNMEDLGPDVNNFFNIGKPFDIKIDKPGITDKAGFFSGLLDDIFGGGALETAQDILDTAKEVAAKVQQVSSTYSNIKSKLPFGLGNKLPDNPLPDVRKFTAKISTIQGAFDDITRIVTEADLAALNVTRKFPPIGPQPPEGK